MDSSSHDRYFKVDIEKSWIYLSGLLGLSLYDGLLFVLVWSEIIYFYQDVIVVF